MVESYGHDLFTGTVISPQAYKAMNPNGRAILKACHYTPHNETPDKEYPFRLSTGRIYAHFHSKSSRLTLVLAAQADFSSSNSSHKDRQVEGARGCCA